MSRTCAPSGPRCCEEAILDAGLDRALAAERECIAIWHDERAAIWWGYAKIAGITHDNQMHIIRAQMHDYSAAAIREGKAIPAKTPMREP